MEPRTEDDSGTPGRVLSPEDASTEPESDQMIVEPRTEDDSGTPGRVLSPEDASTEPESDQMIVEPRSEDDSGTPGRVLSPEDALAEPESDQMIVEPRSEDDSGTRKRVLSPEEVAREFLQEGGHFDRHGRREDSRRRRVRILAGFATAAGVLATVAVLALLAVVALLPSHPPSPPRTPGAASPHPTVPLPPPTSVRVDVLSAYPSGQLLAIATKQRLMHIGFVISGIGTAPSLIAGGKPSEIFYGPSGLRAAETLAQWLIGPVKKVSSAYLSGNDLELWIANPLLGEKTTTTPNSAHPPLGTP